MTKRDKQALRRCVRRFARASAEYEVTRRMVAYQWNKVLKSQEEYAQEAKRVRDEVKRVSGDLERLESDPSVDIHDAIRNGTDWAYLRALQRRYDGEKAAFELLGEYCEEVDKAYREAGEVVEARLGALLRHYCAKGTVNIRPQKNSKGGNNE